MDLLEKLKSSSYHKKEVLWPGTEHKVHIKVLNENDHLQSALAVDKLFKDVAIAIQNIDQYNNELEIQYLFRAIEDPETGKKLFSNITDFRDMLTPEIKNQLSEQLDSFHEEVSPDPFKMSPEEFDKLIKDVKKNAEQTVGAVSNIYTLRKLAVYLATPRRKK